MKHQKEEHFYRIDSNTSKKLKKIRRHIDISEGKIKERLEKFLKSPW